VWKTLGYLAPNGLQLLNELHFSTFIFKNCLFIIDENDDTCQEASDRKSTEYNNYENIECILLYAVPGGPLQLFACYVQLMIVVGLCLDSGKSWTGKFFKTRVMQFLGRISMSLYLIHELMIYWLKFIIYGVVEWKDGENPGLKMPAWAIPIHLVISLIFGVLLTLFIEEPSRKFLRHCLAKRKERNEAQGQNTQNA